jgi:hypothetical protein
MQKNTQKYKWTKGQNGQNGHANFEEKVIMRRQRSKVKQKEG